MIVGLIEVQRDQKLIEIFSSLWDYIDDHIASQIASYHTYHQKNPRAKIPDQYHALRGHTPHARYAPLAPQSVI